MLNKSLKGISPLINAVVAISLLATLPADWLLISGLVLIFLIIAGIIIIITRWLRRNSRSIEQFQ